MERKKFYFASANSGNGFVCNFDSINDNSTPQFQYIIKGGSGSGKSTMMKKIGKYFWEKGFNIEYFYCSSDPESLDGVRIVEKNISIIDGTTPHTFDATLPEIDNKIVNIGEFINSSVKQNESQIKKLISLKKQYYENIYLYLNSASNLIKINKKNNKLIKNNIKINNICKKIIKNIPKNHKNKIFNQRNLFLTSLSKNEIVNLESKNSYKKIIEFNCNENEKNAVFDAIIKHFKKNKYSIICIYDFLNSNEITKIEVENILIKSIINKKINKNIQKNNILIKKLINLAKINLNMAKNCHREIEKFYIKNINFDGVNILTENIINEINNK